MNSLYHAFTPGFNWWYVVSVVLLLAQAAIGAAKYGFEKKLPAIMPRFKNEILLMSASCFTLALTVMVFKESGVGLVQFFDNRLGQYESGFYSLVSAAIVTMAGAAVYLALAYGLGIFAGYAKYGYLAKKRRQIRRQRYRNNKRDQSDHDDNDEVFLKIQKIFGEATEVEVQESTTALETDAEQILQAFKDAEQKFLSFGTN